MMADIDALEERMAGGRIHDPRLDKVLRHAAVVDHWETRYDFFYHLVALRKPQLCLELGCYRGITSAYMCMAAARYGGHVIGIDIVPQHAPQNLMPGMFENFHYILKNTRGATKQVSALVEEHGPIGVVWQDSSHEYAQSVAEWNTYTPLLDQNAIWVCDDLNASCRVDKGGKNLSDYWAERSGGEQKTYADYAPFREGAYMGIIIIDPPGGKRK